MNSGKIAPTDQEKRILRSNGIRQSEIYKLGVGVIREMLDVPAQRARELYAFTEFQTIPSLGPRFAEDLISMGFYSLAELKDKDGAALTNAFEKKSGVWADPCVEDMFRMVVYHAKNPGAHRNWWDFTSERKQYRAAVGYPADRPTRPWFELPQFRRENKVNASRKVSKVDIAGKLKKAARWLKENQNLPVTVKQAAEEASISVYHFVRLFKEVYEVTPYQWLTSLRLKRASRLLRKTRRPVSRIALDCGFDLEGSFIRTFRKQMKESPLQYRKRNQRK